MIVLLIGVTFGVLVKVVSSLTYVIRVNSIVKFQQNINTQRRQMQYRTIYLTNMQRSENLIMKVERDA